MAQTTQITTLAKNDHASRLVQDGHRGNAIAVAMAMFIAAAMLLASCEHKPVMSHANFIHLPVNGWLSTLPLTFTPEYVDSTMAHDVMLSVRHNNSYPYRNISITVDLIATDSTVSRHNVDLPLADQYGNWLGGGFGALYQEQVVIAHDVVLSGTRAIVVWQAMPCDTLRGIVDVGITATPLR